MLTSDYDTILLTPTDLDDARAEHEVFNMLSISIGHGRKPEKVYCGIYKMPHFSGDHLLTDEGIDLETWPELESGNCYGVADSVEQILAHHSELETDSRIFVVMLTEIVRTEQPVRDGWRWHKWGPYIGDHSPQYEYLADETGIESVICYHILEIKKDQSS